jgi:hypothetical protein
MKNIILIAVLSVFVFLSCNNSQSDSHTHDDGTTHSDCSHDQSNGEKHEQEAFEVEADSTHDCGHDSIAESKEHAHTHEDGIVHEH